MSFTAQNTDFLTKEELEIWKNGMAIIAQYDEKMAALLPTLTQWNNALSKNNTSLKEQSKIIDGINSAGGKYNTMAKERESVAKSLDKWQSKLIANNSEEAKQIQAVKVQIQEQNKEYREQAKAANEAAKAKKGLADIPFEVERHQPIETAAEQEERIRLHKEEQDAIMETSRANKVLNDSTAATASVTAEAANATKQLEEGTEKTRSAFERLTPAMQEDIKFVVELEDNIADLRKEQKDLDVQYRNGAIIREEYLQRKSELVALERQQVAVSKEIRKEIANENVEVTRYDASVTDLGKTISIFDSRTGMLVRRVQSMSGVKKVWLAVNNQLVKSLKVSAAMASMMQFALIGLIAGGVMWAINAFKKWREESQRTAKALEEVTQKADFEKVGKSVIKIKDLRSEWVKLGDNLDAKKKFIKENEKAFKDLGVQIDGVKDAENLLINNTGAFVESMKSKARAEGARQVAAEKYAEAARLMDKAEQEQFGLFDKQNLAAGAKAGLAGIAQTFIEGGNLFENIREAKSVFIQDEANKTFEEAEQLYDTADRLFEKSSDFNKKSAEQLKKSGLKPIAGDYDDQKKRLEEIAKLRKKNAEAESKADHDLSQFKISQSAESNLKIVKDDKATYGERLSALDEYVEEQKEAIHNAAQYQEDQLIKEYSLIMSRKDAEKEAANQIALIRAKEDAEITKITQEGNETRLAITEQYAQKQVETISKNAEKTAQIISDNESQALKDLAENYSKSLEGMDSNERLVAEAKYQSDRTAIVRKAAEERMKAEIDALNASLDIAGLEPEQRKKLEEEIGKARLEYTKFVNDNIISAEENAAKKRAEIEEDLAAKRKEIMSGLVDFASALYSNFTDSRLKDLEEYAKEQEKQFDAERDRTERLYNDGAISKEDADARKRAVDDQEEERRTENERREKEMQRKQFLFEQAIAVARIIQQTAASVAQITAAAAAAKLVAMAQLGPIAGPPAVAAITALALSQKTNAIIDAGVQTGIILAQFIPAYAEGTGQEGHKGGWAMVGDGGRPEMVISPSGRTFKTPAYPTLANLEKGSIVLPNYELAMKQIAMPPINRMSDVPPPKPRPDRTGEVVASIQRTEQLINKFMVKSLKSAKVANSSDVVSACKNIDRKQN